MKFKTKPGKKGRSKYLPKKASKSRARKNPMTIKGYQAKERQFNKLTSRRASTLIQAAKLYGQREKLSREMEAWRNWRVPEIQRELEALENKDRSRRRGANKNKWTEADLKKYAKLQEELNQLQVKDLSQNRVAKEYDEHSQKEEIGALMAKYHDYVDRGIIKPRNFVDNYDQASWMSSILTEPEMKKVLEQADKWMEMSAKKRAQRLADEPTIEF